MRRAGRGLVILKGGMFNEEIPVPGFGIGHGPIVSDHQCRSRSDGAFKPTGNLTGYAFTKMLPAALGYDVEIEGLNGAGSTNITVNGVPVTISGSQRYSYVTSNQDYARNILPQRQPSVSG